MADKEEIIEDIKKTIIDSGYSLVEIETNKPWGAYFRIDGAEADKFVAEFFPDLSAVEARLGNAEAELSPKILLVAPGERLSWQYHDRRAERWTFLTAGGYHKSMNDEQGELYEAKPGDVVQFEQGERHRLVGAGNNWTVVAEIWQHVDPAQASDEADITRLADDYSR